jgi:formylmethanofuran dehydrogenase subunit E
MSLEKNPRNPFSAVAPAAGPVSLQGLIQFHEHLGIYSILGAKMGFRAREYFNVGIDELKIKSFVGSRPPVSCLNDGLESPEYWDYIRELALR